MRQLSISHHENNQNKLSESQLDATHFDHSTGKSSKGASPDLSQDEKFTFHSEQQKALCSKNESLSTTMTITAITNNEKTAVGYEHNKNMKNNQHNEDEVNRIQADTDMPKNESPLKFRASHL